MRITKNSFFFRVIREQLLEGDFATSMKLVQVSS